MERLLTTVVCTTENGKAGANAEKLRPEGG